MAEHGILLGKSYLYYICHTTELNLSTHTLSRWKFVHIANMHNVFFHTNYKHITQCGKYTNQRGRGKGVLYHIGLPPQNTPLLGMTALTRGFNGYARGGRYGDGDE